MWMCVLFFLIPILTFQRSPLPLMQCGVTGMDLSMPKLQYQRSGLMKHFPKKLKYNMMTNARQRAKRKGLPFDLSYKYLDSIWPEDNLCPVFGFEMKFNSGKQGANYDSPTLDKIIPSKGYVQGNVIIISDRANRIKTDAEPKEMYKVADFFYELIN